MRPRRRQSGGSRWLRKSCATVAARHETGCEAAAGVVSLAYERAARRSDRDAMVVSSAKVSSLLIIYACSQWMCLILFIVLITDYCSKVSTIELTLPHIFCTSRLFSRLSISHNLQIA